MAQLLTRVSIVKGRKLYVLVNDFGEELVIDQATAVIAFEWIAAGTQPLSMRSSKPLTKDLEDFYIHNCLGRA